MPEERVPIQWIFTCENCGHELRARSPMYKSPCPACRGILENTGSDFEERLAKEVREHEARAKKD